MIIGGANQDFHQSNCFKLAPCIYMKLIRKCTTKDVAVKMNHWESSPACIQETQMESCAPDFSLAQPWLFQPSRGSELANGRHLCVPPSLSPSLFLSPSKVFQIFTFLIKKCQGGAVAFQANSLPVVSASHLAISLSPGYTASDPASS